MQYFMDQIGVLIGKKLFSVIIINEYKGPTTVFATFKSFKTMIFVDFVNNAHEFNWRPHHQISSF